MAAVNGGTLRQERFVARYRDEWREFEEWLQQRGELPQSRWSGRPWLGLRDEDVPLRYRRICQHLALARRRGYSPSVTNRLQDLMQRGHNVLYRAPAARLRPVVDFVLNRFPRLVRAHRGHMLASLLLFVVPLVVCYVLALVRPDMVYTLMDPAQVAQVERMYNPADPTHHQMRGAGTNAGMFGYYIWNNVSIGFRTFASGIFLAIGTVFALVFNGLFAGTVAGHLQQIGSGSTFWPFVVGHSAPELSAIVIAGGAGLRIGMALVAPGRRRRVDALIAAGLDGARLSMGFFAMLVVAALIEAFWSSNGAIPPTVKFVVGGVLWSLVLAWLLLGGRGGASSAD